MARRALATVGLAAGMALAAGSAWAMVEQLGQGEGEVRRDGEDGHASLWVAGIGSELRVIVQGQDFVKEGELVEAVPVQTTSRG